MWKKIQKNYPPSADIPPPPRLLFAFLLMWQYLFHVSDAGITILMQCTGQTATGSKYSKHCCYVPFPNHPQQQLRAECGMLLLKPLQSQAGNIKFCHPKICCYQSLNESITYLFQQKCFLMSIQLWRERNVFDNVMGDVYDGDIWCNFCLLTNHITSCYSSMVTGSKHSLT